jgi:hypothetical protein
MHVTSYLYGETPEAVFRFIEAACRMPYFREVCPVRRDDGQVIAVVFLTGSAAAGIEAMFRRLDGILGRDIEVVTAFDASETEVTGHRRMWVIRGRGDMIRRGEVIRGTLELTPGGD